MAEPKTPAELAQVDAGAAFFRLLMGMVKKHQEAVTHGALVNSAILQAIAEKFPEIGDSYHRYLAESEKSSPVAAASRQLIAELDVLIAKMKD